MERRKVALSRGKDVGSIVHGALDLLDGLKDRIGKADSAFISPNFSIPQKSETGATTNPRVVLALIDYLRKAGCRRIFVGESSICGLDAGAIMKELGATGMFAAAGATVVNLDRRGVKTVTLDVPKGILLKKLEVFEAARNCDWLISVPVLKTHIYTQVSLGMKNLKGTLPDRQKKLFHRIGVRQQSGEPAELDRCIADMMTVHHPDLTLIDATVGQEGFRPGEGITGQPVVMDTVIASSGFVSADAIGAYLMGFDPLSIPHIRYCAQAGLGEADPAGIETVGEDPRTLRRTFKRAVPGRIGTFINPKIVEAGSCSGCSVALRWLFSALSREDIEAMPECTVLVGCQTQPDSRRPGSCIRIGNCAAGKKRDGSILIRGCPPPFFYIRDRLCEDGIIR